MVIIHLCVIHEAARECALTASFGEQRPVRSGDRLNDGGQGARFRRRQMSAVGAGVAEQLVFFVQRLRRVERALGGQAVQAIHVPLEFGQIIQERRRQALRS